jgi:VWFA-related protein
MARFREPRPASVVCGLVAWLWLGAAPPPAARQQPASPPQPPAPQPPASQSSQQPVPTFRTGTNLIRVDVTVIDGRGDPVTSLTANDFEVEDGGQLQAISTFKLVEASGAPADDQSLEIRNPQHAAAEAAKDEVRVFLLFWDDYHVSQFASTLHGREGLLRGIASFGPSDLVAIMDPLTPLDAIRFTRDRRELANQVNKLQGRRFVYTPPRSVVEEAHLMNMGRIEVTRCEVTQSAVKAAAAHLGSLREGPNALIIVTEGFGPCGQMTDMGVQLRDLIQVASGSHTSIFIADPRGLQIRGRLSPFLWSLAEETGGDALQTNDLSLIVKRAVKQASAFYLIGYSKDMPMDGKFHPIKVRVKRRGVEVRSRAGYWAPLETDVARAKENAAKAELTPEVSEALSRLIPPEAVRPVALWIGTSPGAEGRGRVTVAWTARTVAGKDVAVPADVAVTAKAGSAVVFQGSIASGGTAFDAPPGKLEIAATAKDASGEAIDRETRTIAVPDPAGNQLSISTPMVFRSRNPRQAREGRGPIHAGRDFEKTDRVAVTFATSGAAAADGKVAARLLSRGGAPLTTLTVQPDPSTGGYAVDVPLGSIARGEFILSIEASRGDDRAEALVAFRVVR